MHVFGTLSTRGRYYTHAPHTEHEGEYLFGSDIHTYVPCIMYRCMSIL